MANNVFQVKRTSTSGRTPNTTGSYATNSQYISAGEFALNMADGILYSSNGSAVIEVGANNTNQRVTGTLTVTGNVAFTGGANSIALTNTTSNWIYWADAGATAPTFTTRSAGTKLVLYPALTGVQADYAIGIEAATLWSSVPVGSDSFGFKWYGGTTQAASLTGAGNMSLAGSVNATSYAVGTTFIANSTQLTTTVPFSANGGTGTAGQVLTSNGTVGSPYWSTVSGGGGSSVSISSSPPGSPSAGDLWWNSDQGTMKIYYNDGNSSQWVDSTRGTPGPTGPMYGSRLVASADATSITPNANTTDMVTQLNTQAVGTLTINAATGTPTDGQKLMFRIKSTNIQTLSWNAVYAGGADLTLPSATSGSSLTDYYGFIYNSGASKWHLLSKISGF